MIDDFGVTIYMDQRDVTSWVKSVRIRQNDSMTRSFTINFTSWHLFNETNRWDIFASYDSTNPRAENLIRAGVIDPSIRQSVVLSRNTAPKVTAEGHEWVWLAQRKRPKTTIIFAPSHGNIDADVAKAIENFGKPIGEFKVWYNMDSYQQIIVKLMQAAGIRVSCHLPWHPISAFVMDPSYSYYKQAVELAAPYGVLPYYVRSSNLLVLSDQRDNIMGAGNTIEIPDTIVDTLSARPKWKSRPTRVIVRFPPWH